MIKLPEKIRRTLEKIVAELRARENIYGIGLFGSWSRGDAVSSSDVDLFILDKGSIPHEYVERIEINGLFIDLDHVPKKWIHGPIPPEIDQKLYEMQILYDRDWSLTNTKLLMAKSYASPERIDIRTETHIVDADIYLSRATSALARGDFRSAHLFAGLALENILKVLVEIALQPLSNSRFLENLEASTTKLGMQGLFKEFMEETRLKGSNNESVKEKLRLFKNIWDEIQAIAKQNIQTLNSAHFRVKTKLNYYLKSTFLHGTIMRTNSLIEAGKFSEATHYLNDIFVNTLENYVWLKSTIEKIKIDYTTLIRSLEKLEEKNPKNYEHIINFLNLNNIDKNSANQTINKAREIILKIRKNRKVLIKNQSIKT
ncbi:MAG: nucleotidyltransferase domain-containing protein [Candidatus Bathyarchaeota archaeon]|jgi:predicted nucleotidyltransferase|nr:nucleotidyltransferase domain-containing protein [Candidatus Bathyarchaeota archaeon]